MRGFSSVVSVSAHAILGTALLLGTTKAGGTHPIASPAPPPIFFPEPVRTGVESPIGVSGPDIPILADVPPVALSVAVVLAGSAGHATFSPEWTPPASTVNARSGGWGLVDEAGPELLAGPLPVYPELLRQAGIDGQVLLEAVVDSSGRVQPGSVSVVSASHPGFVEPARQALIVSLFRPARVNGKAVSMRVRVPFAFSIRGGIGRAR